MMKAKTLILPPLQLVYSSGTVNPGDGQCNLKGLKDIVVISRSYVNWIKMFLLSFVIRIEGSLCEGYIDKYA
jgi:hypothetical protein